MSVLIFLGFAGSAFGQPPCSGGDPIICADEASFQDKLVELGYRSFREGFENDGTWSAAPAQSIASGAVTWTSNHGGTNKIATSGGSARTGSRGVFSLPHGAPNGVECDHNPGRIQKCSYDGFIGTAPAGLFAVGGWLFSNSGGAEIQFVLDGSKATAIGFDDALLTNQHRFFGVIRTQSFTTFEIRETEGSPVDQEFFFADDFTFGVVDDTAPAVTRINSVADTGDGELSEGEVVNLPITQLLVTFSEPVQDPPVQDPAAETLVDDVTNPANYLLLSDGGNGAFDTTSCAAGLTADDIQIPVNIVTYSPASFTATLSTNGGAVLSAGSYRLLVCGTTSIKDLVGNALDGNGDGTGGDDFARNFSVPANNPPVAVNDGFSVAEGNTLNVAAPGVLFNDTDAEMGPLTAVQVSAPSHGTLTLNADGSLSYTHDGSETTSDSFTYKANDGLLDSNIATVSISVTAVDDAPVAVDDAYTVDEGATLDVAAALGVLSNDTDAEMGPLTAIQVSAPSHGTLTLNADGSLSYTHDGSETTSDSFTYKANDGLLDSNIATVSISVTAVDDAPVAVDDAYTVDEGATLDVAAALGVLSNDTDPEMSPLTAVQVSAPSHGTLTLNADGSLSYTHDGSETTSDSFTYKANDGLLDSNIATVSISVTAVDDAPVAVDDAYTVDEGATLDVAAALGVLSNDTDAEMSPLTAVQVSAPSHGTLTLNADGSFSYTHDGSETTSDSFTYKANDGLLDSNIATVSISVTAVDDAPVAVDDAYTVDEGATLDVAAALGVLSNDTDPEMSPLTAVQVSAPSHGTLTLNADGSFSYTHDGSKTTSDSFTYKANDGLVDSNIATVSISVTAVDDAPVAVDDAYTVDEGATLDVAAALGVLSNDTDPEMSPLTAIQVSAPSHGTLTLNADGSLSYTHDGSETTSDSFTYKANDGLLDSNIATVSISVTAVDDAPVAVDDAYTVDEGATLDVAAALGVLSNDTDAEMSPLTAVQVSAPSHGTLTLNADGSLSYAHDGSETTSDSFTYKANDGASDSNIATVSISVTPVNDAPVATGDTYTVDEGATLDVAAALGVLLNDSDAKSDPLTAVQVSAPSHGTLTLNADGSFSYTHDGSKTTSDSFTYKANDGLVDSNIATVSISVTAVDDAPVAVDDAYTVDEGATLDVAAALGVLSNDTDPEMSPLTAIQVSAPSHGTLTLNADGSFSYTHDGSETTSDSFTYKANDGLLDSNIATVSISVTAVDDAPVAVDDAYTVDEGATLDVAAALGVLSNDTDPEMSPLTAVQVSAPSHGTLTLNADGSLSYTHDGSETTSGSSPNFPVKSPYGSPGSVKLLVPPTCFWGGTRFEVPRFS